MLIIVCGYLGGIALLWIILHTIHDGLPSMPAKYKSFEVFETECGKHGVRMQKVSWWGLRKRWMYCTDRVGIVKNDFSPNLQRAKLMDEKTAQDVLHQAKNLFGGYEIRIKKSTPKEHPILSKIVDAGINGDKELEQELIKQYIKETKNG